MTTVANGERFRRPATIARVEIGDVVSGQGAGGRAAAACVDRDRLAVARMLPTVLRRSPNPRLSCASVLPAARLRLARGVSRLYRQRSRCAIEYLQVARDAGRLRACQIEAAAVFRARVGAVCDPTDLQLVEAEVASRADALVGAWYCAR